MRFPAEGFYPIEIDNAENGEGLLFITLESPIYTPVLSGPSPVCFVPTPLPYPWCPLSPTPATAPTAFPDTISYYVEATLTPDPNSTPTPTPVGSLGYWYDRGVAEAQRMIDNGGPANGIVILDFGEPAYNAGPAVIWGTRYVRTDSFISLDQIGQVAGDFAVGFYKTVSNRTSPPHITLAIGTNNYYDSDYPLTASDYSMHGAEWGSLVNYLAQYFISLKPIVTFDGAIDTEFEWNDADHTIGWTQAYEQVTRGGSGVDPHLYYVYGDCADCYDGGVANADPTSETRHPGGGYTWLLSEMVTADWGNRAAYPLPQIYYPQVTTTPAPSPTP